MVYLVYMFVHALGFGIKACRSLRVQVYGRIAMDRIELKRRL